MKIVILIPVYNDWECFFLLTQKIKNFLPPSIFANVSFLIVNDNSTVDFPLENIPDVSSLEIIDLARNVGHQKAIALGLAYISEHKAGHNVIIMDSDGEDKPEDLLQLINVWENNQSKVIFAKRTKRQEGIRFKFFYKLYKFFFKLLTGQEISFGNFSMMSHNAVKKIVNVSEIWSHYSGGVMRSKLPYTTIALERGKRLTGSSKMNFTALVLHGLSAIAVYIDTVSVRLLLTSFILIISSALGILSVTFIKLFTNLAIPGWATSVIIGLSIILMQAFLVSLFLVFIVLSYRTQKLFIPAKHYVDYIFEIRKIK